MKKIRNIFLIVIGFVIVGMIGTKAASLISSSSVIYKDDNTVEAALDELFEKSNNLNANLRYDEETGYIQALNVNDEWVDVYHTTLPMPSEIYVTSDFTGSTYYDNIAGYRTIQNQNIIGNYDSLFTLSDNYTMTFLTKCKIDITVTLSDFSSNAGGWIGYIYGQNITDTIQTSSDSSTGTDAATRVQTGSGTKTVSINVEPGYKLRFVWKIMHSTGGNAGEAYTAREVISATIAPVI